MLREVTSPHYNSQRHNLGTIDNNYELSPSGLNLIGPAMHDYLSPIPYPVRKLIYPKDALLVIAGPIASGKMTLVRRTVEAGVSVLSPVEIRLRLQEAAGIEEYDASFWQATFEELLDRLEQNCLNGTPTVIPMTSLQRWQQIQVADLANAAGRSAHIIFLDVTAQLCLCGQEERERQVPEEVIHSQVRKWQEIKIDLLADPGSEINSEGDKAFVSICGKGEALIRTRGYSSCLIIDRPGVNRLREISFSAGLNQDLSENNRCPAVPAGA